MKKLLSFILASTIPLYSNGEPVMPVNLSQEQIQKLPRMPEAQQMQLMPQQQIVQQESLPMQESFNQFDQIDEPINQSLQQQPISLTPEQIQQLPRMPEASQQINQQAFPMQESFDQFNQIDEPINQPLQQQPISLTPEQIQQLPRMPEASQQINQQGALPVQGSSGQYITPEQIQQLPRKPTTLQQVTSQQQKNQQLLGEMKLSQQALSPEQQRLIQQIRNQKIAQQTGQIPIVTQKTIDFYYDTKFQKEFKNVEIEYKKLRATLEDLKERLIAFSKQQIALQQNYDHFENMLIAPLEEIRQKPLAIALTKSLQYKSGTNNANLTAANHLIEELKKLILDIENTMKIIGANSEWTSAYFNPNQKIPQTTIAKIFKETLTTKFPFKIKKIKSLITDWEST